MRSLFIVIFFIGAFLAGKYMTTPSTCDAFCAEQITTVSAQEFNGLTKEDVTIIDVRTSEEFNSGHIANAVNSDFYDSESFNKYLDSLDKDGKYLIYCRTGNRSGETLKMMEDKGFKNVINLGGGINSWKSEGLPTSSSQ